MSADGQGGIGERLLVYQACFGGVAGIDHWMAQKDPKGTRHGHIHRQRDLQAKPASQVASSFWGPIATRDALCTYQGKPAGTCRGVSSSSRASAGNARWSLARFATPPGRDSRPAQPLPNVARRQADARDDAQEGRPHRIPSPRPCYCWWVSRAIRGHIAVRRVSGCPWMSLFKA
ncbi:hypothetical protein P171DRAFT_500093 [Karstenula rhodostoma CBS 690.94]|uniref:Uncharacterized protein n=1 Tax=Karstenula rhodostoma CBS 690.94 TaxID=1392251 RepID=A0A9P4P8Z6_9PLEO|nr:hypothetical protein P171DRAFT_500093 [Karstenula rhodostoma CBS 690.94]